MCGRYTLGRQPDSLLDYFHLHGEVPTYHLSWNITPSQSAPVILLDSQSNSGQQRVCQLMRWGLVPAWSRGPDSRFSMINAKAETIEHKPAYKNAFQHKRCLIPCDGFYEWRASKESDATPAKQKAKQPYYVYKQDKSLLALAGIWDLWEGMGEGMGEGLGQGQDEMQQLRSFSIITTDANPFMQNIHHRMPVILNPNQFDQWLSKESNGRDELKSLLVPYQHDDLVMHAVSKAVNSPKNDSAELIEAVDV